MCSRVFWRPVNFLLCVAAYFICLSDARAVADDDATQRRVRELIYVLRQHRVFERCDEWAAAIRELTEIGPAAVPELVRELETTDRDATLRALGFTLRAIGDPRAVPHLIRAIPKTLRRPGSDCGVHVIDQELFDFMKLHDRAPDDRRDFSYGRPVNEILVALERLTGHREPPHNGQQDDLRHVFLRGSDAEQAAQRKQFDERMRVWQDWWAKNWRRFVTKQQLETVTILPRDQDLVARDGLARFGPLFPTGPGVNLGPIHDVVLESTHLWDAKSHIDFDSGRVYEFLEHRASVPNGDDDLHFKRWCQQYGIDVRNNRYLDTSDLFTWLIDDARWDTLEDELRSGKPFDLGREAPDGLFAFDKTTGELLENRGGTFLFTTREGGRGIIKTSVPDKKSRSCRLQYRMFVIDEGTPPTAPEPTAERSGTLFDKPSELTLPEPGDAESYLANLETGRRFILPDYAQSEAPGAASLLAVDPAVVGWCRNQKIDVATYLVPREPAAGDPPRAAAYEIALLGIDMIALPVSHSAFDRFTVERVREIVSRPLDTGAGVRLPCMTRRPDYPQDTWVIQTRDGRAGLLQIVTSSNDPRTVIFRYRLADVGEEGQTR